MFELLFISLLAALISLDTTPFGQFMVSRPIVCAPIIGYFIGDMKSALWVGMIVELMWTKEIPLGAAVPNDAMAVSILATVWGSALSGSHNGNYIIALLIAAPIGVLFKYFDTWVRYFNIHIAHWAEAGVRDGFEERINYSIYLGVLLFFIKSFISYFVFMFAGQWVLQRAAGYVPSFCMEGFNLAWWLLPIAGLGVMLVNFLDKFIKISR